MEHFLDTTTFHGFIYLKAKNKKLKYSWMIVQAIVITTIVVSTVFLTNSYLQYDSFIIRNENELNQIETILNVLFCEHDTLNIVNTVSDFNTEYREYFNSIRSMINNNSKNWINFDNLKLNISYPGVNTDEYTNRQQSFDNTFIKIMVNEVPSVLSGLSCSIINENIRFNCSMLFQNVFTPNGVCLMLNLKNTNKNLWKRYNWDSPSVIIQLELKYKTNRLIYLSFTDNKLIIPSYDSIIYFPLQRRIISNNRNIMVETRIEKYTNDFENMKCNKYSSKDISNTHFNSYEQNCHFECLHLLIRKILNCNFIKPIDFKLKICKISDLVFIEEIFKSYQYIRSTARICKNCLKDCETSYYDTLVGDSDRYNETISMRIHFDFRNKELTHVLKISSSQYLSYINGFWSLFLGISVLSLYELFELVIYYIDKNKEWIRKLSFINRIEIGLNRFSKAFSSVYSNLQVLFHNTPIHGIKHFVDDKTNSFARLRWLIVIIISFLFLVTILYQNIATYSMYQTDMVTTSVNINQSFLNQNNISVMLCFGLLETVRPEWKNNFEILSSLANDLLKKNYSTQQMVQEYMKTANISINLEKFSFNEAKMLYKSYFRLENITIYLNWKPEMANSKLYPLEICFFSSSKQLSSIFSEYVYVSDISYNVQFRNIKIGFADSNKMLVSETMKYNDDFFPFFSINPTIKKLIGKPYKPDCLAQDQVSKYKYNQQNCLYNCLNDIIYNKFGCRMLITGNNENESNYCHPIMLPLIEQYRLLYADAQSCENCLEPCDQFFYKLKLKKLDKIFGLPNIFFLSLHINKILLSNKKLSHFSIL